MWQLLLFKVAFVSVLLHFSQLFFFFLSFHIVMLISSYSAYIRIVKMSEWEKGCREPRREGKSTDNESIGAHILFFLFTRRNK